MKIFPLQSEMRRADFVRFDTLFSKSIKSVATFCVARLLDQFPESGVRAQLFVSAIGSFRTNKKSRIVFL